MKDRIAWQSEAIKTLKPHPISVQQDFKWGTLARSLSGDRSHDPIDVWFGRHPRLAKILGIMTVIVLVGMVVHHRTTFN